MQGAEQSLRAGDVDGLLASACAQLGEYGGNVMRDRLLRAVEVCADLDFYFPAKSTVPESIAYSVLLMPLSAEDDVDSGKDQIQFRAR